MDNFLTPDTNLALLKASQSGKPHSADALKKAREMENIDNAAKDFEAVFISEMMKPMFEGIKTADGDFGGGKGEEVFSGMLLQEYGKLMSRTGSIGIADQVKEAMIQMQEQSNTANHTTNNPPIITGALNNDE